MNAFSILGVLFIFTNMSYKKTMLAFTVAMLYIHIFPGHF